MAYLTNQQRPLIDLSDIIRLPTLQLPMEVQASTTVAAGMGVAAWLSGC